MRKRPLEEQYRTFLLYVTALVLVVAMLELWFSEHTEGLVQLLPFGLAIAGLIATVAVVVQANLRTVWALRVASVVLAAGALYGMYEHVTHNLAFEREIRPAASLSEVVWEALFGASPLLAPAVLGLAALLAAAATYRHPTLERRAAA